MNPASQNPDSAAAAPRPWRHVFALNSTMVAMLGAVVFVGLGERMAERFLPLYLLALGGGVYAIGALNGLVNLLGALYAYPGGWLSDRLGYKRALTGFTLLAMGGYALALALPRWWAVLVGALGFIAWSAISLPAVMSLVARAVPAQKRTMGVSLHSLIRRLPMALGPVLGGVLIERFGPVLGVRLAFGVALALGAVAIFLIQRFIAEPPPRPRPPHPAGRGLRRLFSPALRNLLVSDILIRFTEQIPYAFVVVWAVQLHGISPVQFGLLTAIEMATAVAIYVPVALLADRGTKKPFVLITFVFFTLFPVALLFARSFPALVGAFVLRGLKEFGEPTRKALIMDLAPESAKAETFGAYYLVRDTIVALAAFGGAWLWQLAPAVNLLTACTCGLAGTLYFARYGRDLKAVGQAHPTP